LKCWPKFFNAVWDGTKTFEVRRGDDRKYEVGDEVILREYFPEDCTFGRSLKLRITYVLHDWAWLPAEWWVFSFVVLR
jgi:hypothetical protein